MDWYNFLEDATCTIRNNHEASNIRRELLSHLESITDDLVTQGWSLDKARQEALHRMGSPENIAKGFLAGFDGGYYPKMWIFAWTGLAIGAIGIMNANLYVSPFTTAFFIGLTGLSILGLTLLQIRPQPDFRSRWNIFLSMLRPEWSCLLSAGIVGILAGSRPIWFASPYHWVAITYILLMASLTGVPVILRFVHTRKTGERWSPGLIAPGMGSIYGIVSMATGVILGHIWPQAPSQWVHWFGLRFLEQNLHLIPVYAVGIWGPSMILALSVKWWMSQLCITRYRKTVS